MRRYNPEHGCPYDAEAVSVKVAREELPLLINAVEEGDKAAVPLLAAALETLGEELAARCVRAVMSVQEVQHGYPS
jgi:type VI protein secretion system component VasF